MFGTKTSSNDVTSLDLSTLESYSPRWSPQLRLATCVATKYAVSRCIERSNFFLPKPFNPAAEPQPGNPQNEASSNLTDTMQQAIEFAKHWEEYGQKFLTATCQHLGVSEQSLPPAPINLEDVLASAQGRIAEDDPAKLVSNFEPAYESGSDHMRKHPNLFLPIPGCDDGENDALTAFNENESLHTNEMEKAFAQINVDPDSSPKSDLTDCFEYDQDAKVIPECDLQRPSGSHSLQQQQHVSTSAANSSQTGPHVEPDDPKRIQGAIDTASGQEIEVAHELLLIALGLGQFRAQDGCTTLFEQDMLFGETELDLAHQESHIQLDQPHVSPPPLPPRNKMPDQSNLDTSNETQSVVQSNAKPSNEASNAVTGAGKRIAEASKSVFGSLKSNTVTGWEMVSSSSRELLVGDSSKSASPKQSDKNQPRKPVKPNEICHYDSRARAIIFVTVTAMGIAGKQVWLAEKVMAQTIYFIMSEGNRASTEKNGKDLIESLPSNASLETKPDSTTQASSDRSAWMNQHSSLAVEKEKEKVGWSKWAAMGGGFLAGGLVIGLTGGLATPLIAPALVGLTGVSFLATSGGIIMLGTLFGLGGGGLAGYKVERRLRGVSSFSFAELQTEARKAGVAIPSLHATICCSGLLLDEADQVKPWQQAFERATDGRDAFAIQCEAKMMKKAGQGLKGYMLDQLLRSGGQKAAQEVIKRTALAGFAALTLPLTVFSAASATLDGVFVRAKTRSHKAGIILAETLKNEVQGHRPVILIGTSLGAATILSALIELAKDPEANDHLIDSVFLISAPITPSPSTLRSVRRIVQRRFVNVFSSNDMVCGIAAWLGSGISIEELKAGKMPRVMGSRPIDSDLFPGIENINVSDLISSHFEVHVAEKLEPILQRCGFMND